jgi:pSer/pThr/pTyr-binding forkhead associated (FHA) protein
MTAPPHIVVQLIHIQGGLKGEIQEFHDPLITVGRLSTCSVKFPPGEPGVSREHARIQREGNQFKLIDLSKYGTYVNGKQAKEMFLRNGDVLEFGPGGPKVSITMEIVTSLPYSAPTPSPQPQSVAVPVFAPPVMESQCERQPTAAAISAQSRDVVEQFLSSFTPLQKAMAPLVIQFGATIRTYRELPVTLGAGTGADFTLRHQGILDLHAQIFFYKNSYWIKDLTGQGLVRINHRPAEAGGQLNTNDEILCGPQGPTFRYLGNGRLAEVEAVAGEPACPRNAASEQMIDSSTREEGGNLFSKLVKAIKR